MSPLNRSFAPLSWKFNNFIAAFPTRGYTLMQKNSVLDCPRVHPKYRNIMIWVIALPAGNPPCWLITIQSWRFLIPWLNYHNHQVLLQKILKTSVAAAILLWCNGFFIMQFLDAQQRDRHRNRVVGIPKLAIIGDSRCFPRQTSIHYDLPFLVGQPLNDH